MTWRIGDTYYEAFAVCDGAIVARSGPHRLPIDAAVALGRHDAETRIITYTVLGVSDEGEITLSGAADNVWSKMALPPLAEPHRGNEYPLWES